MALEEKFNTKNLVISLSNFQVHLNNPLIAKSKLDEKAIRQDIVEFLRKIPTVSFVVDNDKLGVAALPDELIRRIKNSYNLKRSGVITYGLEPGWYSGSNPTATGTTHGSWNSYDAHIPMLWMGWGIKHGSLIRHTNMSDIAPTLAALLHIQEPNGCIGKPIEELIKK